MLAYYTYILTCIKGIYLWTVTDTKKTHLHCTQSCSLTRKCATASMQSYVHAYTVYVLLAIFPGIISYICWLRTYIHYINMYTHTQVQVVCRPTCRIPSDNFPNKYIKCGNVCVRMWIRMHTHTHTHIYICTDTHTHTQTHGSLIWVDAPSL